MPTSRPSLVACRLGAPRVDRRAALPPLQNRGQTKRNASRSLGRRRPTQPQMRSPPLLPPPLRPPVRFPRSRQLLLTSADGACAARPPAAYVRLPLPPPALPTAQQWGAVVAPGRSSGPPIALGAPPRLVPASLPLPVTGIQRLSALPSPPKGGRPRSLRPDSGSASGTGAAPQRPLQSAAGDPPKAPSAALH